MKCPLCPSGGCAFQSHPARGGWIEMCAHPSPMRGTIGPTPHGVGGLKCFGRSHAAGSAGSHPARGGWIEMLDIAQRDPGSGGPTPHGVGGLKCHSGWEITPQPCPTPHGVGGLKYRRDHRPYRLVMSHPARGGWIEIFSTSVNVRLYSASPTPHGVGGLK